MTAKKTAPSKCVCQFCDKKFESWIKKRFCSQQCTLAAWRVKRRDADPGVDLDQRIADDDVRYFGDSDHYAVSRSGEVFSRRSMRQRGTEKYRPWKQMASAKAGSRKQYHYLTVAGKRWGLHQLVAHVFIGPRPPGEQVRHLDRNPSNNRVSNLAYGTAKQNMSDAIGHGTTCKGTRNARSVLDERSVRAIRRLHEADMLTQTAIAQLFDVSLEAVTQVVHRKRWGWLDEPKGT